MKSLIKKICFTIFLFLSIGSQGFTWGFFAHMKINRLAVFTLPTEMAGFYKHHIQYITENAVNPDRRRYAVEGEAIRHYIDIDAYGDSALFKIPRYWKTAVNEYSEDTLKAHGIVPWNVYWFSKRLTDAFIIGDTKNILRISADLGHYIADANVPLHTTKNYNGQLTGQHGIHGFWESRLPEQHASDYNFFVGKARYIENLQLEIWSAIEQAHNALDSVLLFESALDKQYAPDKKYSFEERGAATVKVYSKSYTEAYHKKLNGMVERQMRASIKLIGDFWYTCWVNAGQPDLDKLIDQEISEEILKARKEELKQWKQRKFQVREHEDELH